jgi:hypothetical protein
VAAIGIWLVVPVVATLVAAQSSPTSATRSRPAAAAQTEVTGKIKSVDPAAGPCCRRTKALDDTGSVR